MAPALIPQAEWSAVPLEDEASAAGRSDPDWESVPTAVPAPDTVISTRTVEVGIGGASADASVGPSTFSPFGAGITSSRSFGGLQTVFNFGQAPAGLSTNNGGISAAPLPSFLSSDFSFSSAQPASGTMASQNAFSSPFTFAPFNATGAANPFAASGPGTSPSSGAHMFASAVAGSSSATTVTLPFGANTFSFASSTSDSFHVAPSNPFS